MAGWCGDILEKFNIQPTLCQTEMPPKLIYHNHTRWQHYPYYILLQRLTPHAQKIIVDHPHRFQHNRSTVSHIPYLKKKEKKKKEKKKKEEEEEEKEEEKKEEEEKIIS